LITVVEGFPGSVAGVIDLDDPRCANLRLAGAKAAWLARGRQHGLSILPGVVVVAEESVSAMAFGKEVLRRRGSGGARLELSQLSLRPSLLGAITEASAGLGESLAVRSSSVLEGHGEWAGAFASYMDIFPTELTQAITGCWASNFNVDCLKRYEAAGFEPGSAPMAILIQPFIHATVGGVARLERDHVVVTGIKGSPAPLVHGWESGVTATVSRTGHTEGDEAISMLGPELIRDVAQQMLAVEEVIGANLCEWAVDRGRLFLLQLGRQTIAARSLKPRRQLLDPRFAVLARLARRYPGPLGEALVLAWAVAAPDLAISHIPDLNIHGALEPAEALRRAANLATALTAHAWGLSEPIAVARAAAVLRQLRGSHPDRALEVLFGLARPDHRQAAEILSLLGVAQQGRGQSAWHLPLRQFEDLLRDEGASKRPSSLYERVRIGADRWEPFQALVVQSFGEVHAGTPASPGAGCGRLCFIDRADQVELFRPRDVVFTTQPVPNLAPLLWDAAGLVTLSGGPGAHLFEAARSLNVPAVCGIGSSFIGDTSAATLTGRHMVAVDGDNGRIHLSEW
jgi:hypothetical protein